MVNPATEAPIRSVAFLDTEEVDAAIAPTRSQQVGSWRDVAPADRARLLRRLAAAVDAHVDELADLEVANAGQPIRNARGRRGTCVTSSSTTPVHRSA